MREACSRRHSSSGRTVHRPAQPSLLPSFHMSHRRPLTRWVRALRPDPMKRLRLNTRDAVEEKLAVTAGDVRTVLGRSSLPPPTPAANTPAAVSR